MLNFGPIRLIGHRLLHHMHQFTHNWTYSQAEYNITISQAEVIWLYTALQHLLCLLLEMITSLLRR